MYRDQDPKGILGFTMTVSETGNVCYTPVHASLVGGLAAQDVAPTTLRSDGQEITRSELYSGVQGCLNLDGYEQATFPFDVEGTQ